MTMRSSRPERRVDREHHAGARGLDLALDDHGDVHVGLREAALGAVEDGAGAEQRRPAAAHGVDDRVGAADVQEGLVHAGERRRLGVLAGRRRAHGDRGVLAAGRARVGLRRWRRAASRAPARPRRACARSSRRPPSAAVSSTSRPSSASITRSRRPFSSQNAAYAGAPTTKPGGTGSPAAVISPRFAPLPPAKSTSVFRRSPKRRTDWIWGVGGAVVMVPPASRWDGVKRIRWRAAAQRRG